MRFLLKAVVLSTIFVFLLCAGSDDTKTNKAKSQAKMQKFVTYSYNDPSVEIEVFRLLIPDNWKVEGAVNWVAVPALPAKVNFRFYDTKSLAEFNLFPAQDYFWTDNQMFLYTNPPGSLRFGTPVAQPIDLHTAFTQVIIPKYRGKVSDLKIIEEKEVPDLAKLAKGLPTQGVAASAEAGKLDAQTKLFQIMLYSLKVNPQWYAKVANVKEYLAQLVIQNIQATGRMSQIITQASSEMREDQQKAWEYRQGVNDKIAQNFSDYVMGVDRYYDPYAEKQVQLPTGYNNVWSNNLGEYILSEDPNYNPNVGSNLNWQQLNLAK